ncbi:calcium/proton exchanger [Tanacetum coccineum]
MEPTLGMRYETPYQLKLALANYGVAHGYQLWYMKNDWREVLVYCGRNVEEGRCAGKKGNKYRVMKNKVRSGVQTGVKKKVVKKKVLKKKVVKKKPVLDFGEGTSQSPKWTKKQIKDSKQVVCPFRMNYNFGSLVTFRWIALHFFKEIIEDPFMSLRKMRADIRKKFMIDVILGQCRRAKQLSLFDHEGGLIEHYGRLYQYRQALLDSNPGSTCRLDVEESSNGLNDENGITIISDSHKGLIDAVNDWLPKAEHRKYTRHIKQLDEGAYDYLIKRNPNSWSRAFFEMDRRCAAFENGISESFNRAILEPRHKPIITMLEEIRLYIMQRLVAMNKIATNLQDTITPSIRKRLEVLKEKQSGFQELEVRKYDQSYGVNLQHKVCQCRMWELSGVPCVHAVAAYLHCGIEIDLGVSHWTNDVPPLPPLIRRMPGRPQKSRIKDPCETSGSHTRVEVKVEMKMKPVLVEWVVLMKLVVEGDEVLEEEVGRRGGGRGNRAVGSTRGGMAGSSGMGLLTSEELDEEAFRECMEEQAREQAKNDAEQERMETSETTNVAEGIGSAMEEELHVPVVDKGKGVASVAQQDNAPKKKRGRPPSHVDGVRIYHKNRGRSERIAKMKEKKAFEFDKHGTGSTPNKAFDVSD